MQTDHADRILYAFGAYRLDPGEHVLLRDGRPVSLTPKAFETLVALVERSGHVVEKDTLLQRVWPDTSVEEATLAQNVFTLRKTLGDTSATPQYIETVPKVGYRFVASVERLAAPPGVGPETPATGTIATARRSRWWVVAAVVAVLVVAGDLVVQRFTRAARTGRVMLAVLPFENLGGDPAQEYLSDGLTEEMITQLGQLSPQRLGVIAHATAMTYRGTHKTAGEIGRELHVDYLLEGSVRRLGDRVRVSAQLIAVPDQTHLWAESYDRDTRDLLALESGVAGAIARQVEVNVTPATRGRQTQARTVDPDAYDLYLRGRYFWNKRTADGYQKAIALFEKAVAQDPNYAQAHAGLADAYALLGSVPNAALPRRDAMTRAREAAQKALSLDDSLADAHASLGFVKMHYDWDFTGAQKEFLRAIELNPGYATAHHWYAYDLVALGTLDQAVVEVRRAEKADPLSVIISSDVGELLMFAGRDDEAIAQCRRTLEMDPNFFLAHGVLAWTLRHTGNEKEFLEELAKSENASRPATVGVLDVLTGRKADARRVLAQLLASASKNATYADQIVVLYALLGDHDSAFAWLERAFQERDGGLILMRVEPEWEPLWSDPRFADFVRRVGIQGR